MPTAAVAGEYHAVISFSDGTTRDEAVAKPPLATLTVNVDLQADIKELLQLNSFTTDNIVFSGDDVLFKYQIQNIGNQALNPKGEVRIYDRKGEEVASVDVNSQGNIVSPDQDAQMASVWSGAQGFGQYKAVLDVDYGSSQVASVQDVAYFWVIPWKQLLAITIIALCAFIFLALYFHRWLEERHFGKLAAAGMLKAEALVHPSGGLPPSRLQTVIEEKKEQFSDLKRKGLVPAAKPAAAPQQPAPSAPPQSAQPAPAPVQGGTIDLKNMWKQEPSATTPENHIINLKGK